MYDPYLLRLPFMGELLLSLDEAAALWLGAGVLFLFFAVPFLWGLGRNLGNALGEGIGDHIKKWWFLYLAAGVLLEMGHTTLVILIAGITVVSMFVREAAMIVGAIWLLRRFNRWRKTLGFGGK